MRTIHPLGSVVVIACGGSHACVKSGDIGRGARPIRLRGWATRRAGGRARSCDWVRGVRHTGTEEASANWEEGREVIVGIGLGGRDGGDGFGEGWAELWVGSLEGRGRSDVWRCGTVLSRLCRREEFGLRAGAVLGWDSCELCAVEDCRLGGAASAWGLWEYGAEQKTIYTGSGASNDIIGLIPYTSTDLTILVIEMHSMAEIL